MFRARTIVESEAVQADLARLTALHPRFDEWWTEGWSWRLARDPIRDATLLPKTDPQQYLLKTSPLHAKFGFPFTLTFLYTVTDDVVAIQSIRVVDLEVPA